MPLRSRFDSLIPGVRGGAPLTVRAPFDRRPIGRLATIGAAGLERALRTAHGLFRDRERWLPLTQRIAILERAAQLLAARAEDFAREAAREGGKPLTDSRAEVARAVDCLKLCVQTVRNDQGEVIPMGLNAASAGRIAFTQTAPIGVVAAISAFNHPVNLVAHQLGPAVAAGCPVLVKPASATPLSCFRFVELLREAGLPGDWCQPLLFEDQALATRLATDPRVAFLSFIGSAAVGWELKAKLAPGTRCALEHGGVAPVIVAADADWKAAVAPIVKGGYYHAGQVCVSVQRVYVDRRILAPFARALAAAVRKLRVGDPVRETTQVGPMIDPREVQRVGDWVREAVQGGAQLLCGGKARSRTCYAPTLLLDPPEAARISRDEVFGPVVCLYGYTRLDDALRRANALPAAFQAAVFTRSIDTALACHRGFDASAVMVNDHTAFRVDWMPFAGLRTSGEGVGGIPYTIHDLQVRKLLVIRSAAIRR